MRHTVPTDLPAPEDQRRAPPARGRDGRTERGVLAAERADLLVERGALGRGGEVRACARAATALLLDRALPSGDLIREGL